MARSSKKEPHTELTSRQRLPASCSRGAFMRGKPFVIREE